MQRGVCSDTSLQRYIVSLARSWAHPIISSGHLPLLAVIGAMD
jgi:hypothetical protein